MGEQADYMLERELNRHMSFGHFDKQACTFERLINAVAKSKWTMKCGTTITFADMTLSHLENVVKLSERRKDTRAGLYRVYLDHRKFLEQGK